MKQLTYLRLLALTGCNLNGTENEVYLPGPAYEHLPDLPTQTPIVQTRNILVIVICQSNTGYVWKLAGTKPAKVWVNAKSRFEYRKIHFAQTVKQALPNDSLIFYEYHKGGTNLAVEWKAPNGPQLTLAKTGLDKALSNLSGTKIHKVVMIWLQGERDAKLATMAPDYLTNEKALFSFMRDTYQVGNIYSHQINANLPAKFKSQVIEAKRLNQDSQTKLIELAPNFYRPDNTHLTDSGVREFSGRIAVMIEEI